MYAEWHQAVLFLLPAMSQNPYEPLLQHLRLQTETDTYRLQGLRPLYPRSAPEADGHFR